MLGLFLSIVIIACVWFGLIGGAKQENKIQGRTRQFGGTLGIMVALLVLMLSSRQGVVWEPYSPEKIAEAQKVGKPVIIDFYADWCLPCLQLDEITYADPGVARALDRYVKLKLDATDMSNPDVIEANEHFGVIGLPTVVFLAPDGQEPPATRITGFIDPHKLIELLYSERFKELGLR